MPNSNSSEVSEKNRRDVLRLGAASIALPMLASLGIGCSQDEDETTNSSEPENESGPEPNSESTNNNDETQAGASMKIQYLEIVTPEADALCKQYSAIHGVTFGEPDANLGGARTAEVTGGGFIAIRGPLRDTETPVIRPYVLVDDIKAAVAAAKDAGAEIAIESMAIPGHGTIAIVIQGGIECGLWQN